MGRQAILFFCYDKEKFLINAILAQLAERRTCNTDVEGSSPSDGLKYFCLYNNKSTKLKYMEMNINYTINFSLDLPLYVYAGEEYSLT